MHVHDLSWLSPMCLTEFPCGQTGCLPGKCAIEHFPQHLNVFNDFENGLYSMAISVKPQTVIFNQGLWDLNEGDFSVNISKSVDILVRAGRRFLDHNVTRLFWRVTSPTWRTTTPTGRKFEHERLLRELQIVEQASAWQSLNIFSAIEVLITKSKSGNYTWALQDDYWAIFWDTVHFHPYVNRGINELLLMSLIPEECEFYTRGDNPFPEPASGSTKQDPFQLY